LENNNDNETSDDDKQEKDLEKSFHVFFLEDDKDKLQNVLIKEELHNFAD